MSPQRHVPALPMRGTQPRVDSRSFAAAVDMFSSDNTFTQLQVLSTRTAVQKRSCDCSINCAMLLGSLLLRFQVAFRVFHAIRKAICDGVSVRQGTGLYGPVCPGRQDAQMPKWIRAVLVMECPPYWVQIKLRSLQLFMPENGGMAGSAQSG